MALKTVYICWRNLKSDENAMKIFIEAGKIYDKFDVFIKNYERLENQIIAIESHSPYVLIFFFFSFFYLYIKFL
jgi:DNA anti-recombination protein RmuC